MQAHLSSHFIKKPSKSWDILAPLYLEMAFVIFLTVPLRPLISPVSVLNLFAASFQLRSLFTLSPLHYQQDEKKRMTLPLLLAAQEKKKKKSGKHSLTKLQGSHITQSVQDIACLG